MKTPGDGSSSSSAGKKRHKRRAHAASDASGLGECSGNDRCELCSSPVPPSRSVPADKRNVHSSSLVHDQGDSSLVAAFYCKTAQLHGLLQQKMQATLSAGGADFSEDGVLSLGNHVIRLVGEALSITRRCGSSSTAGSFGSCGSFGGPGNPFVMLLSVLLPPLRKFLAWTWTTRSVWYGASAPSSLYHQLHSVAMRVAADSTARSSASTGSSRVAISNPVLWSMLAQHDVVASLASLLTAISRLIEQNSDEAEDAPRGSSQSSSSTVSVLSSSEAPGGSSARRIPQVHHITLEFEDVFSEYRVCLAELTECLVENMETIASRLCRPVLTKDTSKTRGSVNDFIELLVLQILDPVAKRFVESPSTSHLYLLPRLLDKCISVVIDEFVLHQGVRMNEIVAAQVEKGAMYLRTWSLRVETDYNSRARALASANHDRGLPHRSSALLRGSSVGVKTHSRGVNDALDSPSGSRSSSKISRANSSQDDIRGRLDARLELTTLDGFKRLDNHIKQWLRCETNDTAAPLPGLRLRGGNLAEGLRESFVRTFTARNSGGSVPLEGERS